MLEELFSPLRINGLELPNRVVMAPMSRHFSQDGVMPAEYGPYYARRAAGGVGLIVSECAGVPHPTSLRTPHYPAFFGEDALAMWRNVLGEVRRAGGHMIPQIWHAGLAREAANWPDSELPPSGPSGIFMALDGVGQSVQQVAAPLRDSEIADIITAFAAAAATARELGFDGVEIHGAHGYLIDQFFWPRMNRRDDRYGGRGAAATRFASEVITACRASTAPDFPIFFRWSQWKQQDYSAVLAETPKALEQMLTPLVDAGADLLHVSLRKYWEPAFAESDLTLAGWTRKLSGLPVCTVGSIGLDRPMEANDRPGTSARFASPTASAVAIDRLAQLFERDEFDLFAVGRALLADPDWAAKARDGRLSDIIPYSADCLRDLR